MAGPGKRQVIRALLDRHGRTFAEELKIDLHKGTSSALEVETDSPRGAGVDVMRAFARLVVGTGAYDRGP